MHNKWLELVFKCGLGHFVNMEYVVNNIINNARRDDMKDRYSELIALNAKLFGVISEIERLVEQQKIDDDRFVLSWDEYLEELNKENRRLSYNSLRLMHASN